MKYDDGIQLVIKCGIFILLFCNFLVVFLCLYPLTSYCSIVMGFVTFYSK